MYGSDLGKIRWYVLRNIEMDIVRNETIRRSFYVLLLQF